MATNRFTIRVELHNSEDYTKLHEEMEDEGFTRTIKLDTEPTTYHLPTAEYNKWGEDLTSEEVLESAKRAASQVTKNYSVLVTKAAERRYWYNLKAVK